MAIIKSYTDLSQSKKLAKFLPLESADMYWYLATKGNPKAMFNEGYNEYGDFELTCWSLAALLGVLPQGEYEDTDLCFGGYEGDKYIPEWFCSYEQQEPFIFEVSHADNPVDACVAMIEKLHELKML